MALVDGEVLVAPQPLCEACLALGRVSTSSPSLLLALQLDTDNAHLFERPHDCGCEQGALVGRLHSSSLALNGERWTGQRLDFDLPKGLALADSSSIQREAPTGGCSGHNTSTSTALLLNKKNVSVKEAAEKEEGNKSEDWGQTALTDFKERVGGHSLLFKIGEDKIAKPCNPNERAVYEAIPLNSEMGKWVARFYGTLSRPEDSGVGVRSFQRQGEYIVLENLLSQFRKPSVLDLKFGFKSWGPSDVSEKIAKRKFKAKLSGAAEYGFRVSGVRVYYPHEGLVWQCDQKSMIGNCKRFVESLELFLYNGITLRKDVLEAFVAKLRALRDCLATHREIDFVASSLLMIYEGDISSNLNEAAKVDIRIIDFDHAEIRSPKSAGSIPTAAESAVQSIQRVFESICAAVRSSRLAVLDSPRLPRKSNLAAAQRRERSLSTEGLAKEIRFLRQYNSPPQRRQGTKAVSIESSTPVF